MKTLFVGGIKSGKSALAEKYILKHTNTPIYLATTEILDDEMRIRVDAHIKQRADKFETIEEARYLFRTLESASNAVLVECITMWLNNLIYYGVSDEAILAELETIMNLDKDIVFVLNDIGSGVIPDNVLARRFVDLSGKASQIIASKCDEVYHVIAGIQRRIK